MTDPSPTYKQFYDRIKYRIKRRGVPLLDRESPGWRSQLGEVDMENHTRCAVGLLFPTYREGIRALSGLTGERELFDWTVQHGFDVRLGEPYGILNQAWSNELNRRETRT